MVKTAAQGCDHRQLPWLAGWRRDTSPLLPVKSVIGHVNRAAVRGSHIEHDNDLDSGQSPSASPLFVVDGVVNGDPDIQQAESGDESAGDAVQGQRGELGNDDQQAVFIPQVQPGQYQKDEAQVETNDHPDKKIEAPQPARGMAGCLRAWRLG